MVFCVLENCRNHLVVNCPEVKLYSFPNDAILKTKWEEYVSIANNSRFVATCQLLCSDHFEQTMFIDGELCWKGVPTVELHKSADCVWEDNKVNVSENIPEEKDNRNNSSPIFKVESLCESKYSVALDTVTEKVKLPIKHLVREKKSIPPLTPATPAAKRALMFLLSSVLEENITEQDVKVEDSSCTDSIGQHFSVKKVDKHDTEDSAKLSQTQNPYSGALCTFIHPQKFPGHQALMSVNGLRPIRIGIKTKSRGRKMFFGDFTEEDFETPIARTISLQKLKSINKEKDSQIVNYKISLKRLKFRVKSLETLLEQYVSKSDLRRQLSRERAALKDKQM